MIKFIFIILLLSLTSCIPAIFGATASTGVIVAQERSMGSAIDDYTIWTKIKSAYLQQDINNLFHNIDVKVNEGRVLLTGHTSDAEIRLKAVELAWEQKGVQEVIDEVTLAESTNKLALKDYSIDTWITAQVKLKLLFNKNIRAINYTVETLNQTVYLFGIAQDQEELDIVSDIVSNTKFVRHVVSHVRLKDNVNREKYQ